ncbi:hypothetical protein JTE90_028435 [Oedothorax gibbosus]|uniref:Uncharacterized protein n=1 Tax=Oedothorax gibbosus TaxID=931172 RepID=A0AAV6VHX0_9ARAC|nr:hypothetical protein JTE90_028435 [Oedothorax gibbosus]
MGRTSRDCKVYRGKRRGMRGTDLIETVEGGNPFRIRGQKRTIKPRGITAAAVDGLSVRPSSLSPGERALSSIPLSIIELRRRWMC